MQLEERLISSVSNLVDDCYFHMLIFILSRLIYEHLQQYYFTSMGGMMAICDVNEYG